MVVSAGDKESCEREFIPGPKWALLTKDLSDNLRLHQEAERVGE